MLTVGAVLAAFAIEEFLVPCTILDGGLIGVGIIIHQLADVPLSILTIVLNVPFLLFGTKKLGIAFIGKAIYAMIIFSVFLEVFAPLANATQEYILAVCFGGVILGVGVGLVIRFGGCLDGTETVAILLNRKFNFQVGRTVLLINVLIYSAAGIIFGLDRAMYSLLTYIITSKIVDYVETGLDQAKALMIITDEGAKIAEEIYRELGRTVTMLEGEGLVSGKKVVLYCVINRFELFQLKQVIQSVDASAFITVSDVSEIIGKHIKKKDIRVLEKE
ncbi:MAG: YitT family protein [Lachnospiraceae bacterium]|nr:YitT family protein [Lachnospiraceae bacterium]